MRNPKKGSCYSRPKRGRGIRALKTGEGDDKVINTQESHLAALLGSRDRNSWLSVLCVGMGEKEEGRKAPSQMPWSESCKCKGRAGPQSAFPTQLPEQTGNFWCTSHENLDLCPSYTFTKKTSLSVLH